MAAYTAEEQKAARKSSRAKWAANNPSYQREWIRQKRAGDPVFRKRGSERARKWQIAHPFHASWIQYRVAAKRRGIRFDLTREVLDLVIVEECFYCGANAQPANGVDRVDNKDAYRIGNVVSCCSRCNRAKGVSSVDDFQAWAERLSTRVEKWKA